MYKSIACAASILISSSAVLGSNTFISVEPRGIIEFSPKNILTSLPSDVHQRIAFFCTMKTLLALRATDTTMQQLWIIDATKRIESVLHGAYDDDQWRVVIDLDHYEGTIKNKKVYKILKLFGTGSVLKRNYRLKFENMNRQGFEIFCNHFGLVTLDFGYTPISCEAVTIISDYIGKNKWQLKKLELPFSGIGEMRKIKLLAESLKHNTTLTDLVLYSNSICTFGMNALAEGLTHNTTLKKLDLAYNSERKPTFTKLAECLLCNTSLTKLHLRGNFMNDEDSKTLAKNLSTNTTLTFLDVSCSLMSDEVRKLMRQSGTALKKLWL